MRLCKQLSTGMPIVTPSAGDIAADTVHAASPASLARQYPRDFPDKPLSSTRMRQSDKRYLCGGGSGKRGKAGPVASCRLAGPLV